MSVLGERLRRLRHERKCTLQQVSEGSGLTPSFLSRLERGIVNISVGNLRKVAAFFGVPITHFFVEELTPHGIVVRAGGRQARTEDGIERASLLPREAGALKAEQISIAAGRSGKNPVWAGNRTLVYLLSGNLTCRVGNQTHTLGPGDILYQRRPSRLEWANKGTEPVVLITAVMRSEAP